MKMEGLNLNREGQNKDSLLAKIRDSINSKVLKILGPVAFASLVSSCGESEQRTLIEKFEGKPGVESVKKEMINEVQRVVDLAKEQKKTRFEMEGSTDLEKKIVNVDTVLNSVSYTERSASYNKESGLVDHHDINTYYSVANDYFQFFDEETTIKDGKELPKNTRSILANREKGVILKAANFKEGEPDLENIYVLDRDVGPFGNKEVAPEVTNMLSERLSSLEEVVGPVYNPKTNEFENLDGKPLPKMPE